MKPLTTEQQEQAIDLIGKLSNETMQINAPFAYYIQSAKAFLNSLKPKVYVCCLEVDNFVYLENLEKDYWCDDIQYAKSFNSIEEYRELISKVEKNEGLNTSS